MKEKNAENDINSAAGEKKNVENNKNNAENDLKNNSLVIMHFCNINLNNIN